MVKQTLEDWRAEARERFGEKTAVWRFVCPKCGNVQTPQDFVEAGVEVKEAANMSYQGCIGRKVQGKGCNWAAFGLLGTLGKGRVVVTPDSCEVEIFDFAENEK